MKLTRCENGHFYDADKYDDCPHCLSQNQNEDLTQGLTVGTEESIGDVDLTSAVTTASLDDDVSPLETTAKNAAGYPVSENVTVAFYDGEIKNEPVVGWLVAVSGPQIGNDFRLKAGRNFVGRQTDQDVRIHDDETVSRSKHAIVVFEPKTHKFIVQPGESKELSYVNGEVVLNAIEIKAGDKITVGKTDLLFIPFCSEAFNWEMLKKEEKGGV